MTRTNSEKTSWRYQCYVGHHDGVGGDSAPWLRLATTGEDEAHQPEEKQEQFCDSTWFRSCDAWFLVGFFPVHFAHLHSGYPAATWSTRACSQDQAENMKYLYKLLPGFQLETSTRQVTDATVFNSDLDEMNYFLLKSFSRASQCRRRFTDTCTDWPTKNPPPPWSEFP